MVEGKKIAGLGEENSDRGSSLWTYDVRDREHPAVTARLRLGARITEDAEQTVGGAAPTGVTAEGDAVYVSLAHEDQVAKVSADGTRLLAQADLSPLTGPLFQDRQGRIRYRRGGRAGCRLNAGGGAYSGGLEPVSRSVLP